MSKKFIFVVGVIFCLSFVLTRAYAQEEATTTKVQKGLRFQVPEDWPIEERAGVVAPIPVEEYISIKFKGIEAQLDVIRQDLANKFGELNSALDDFKAETNDRLEQIEADMDSVKADTQDLSLGLDQFKARLNSTEGDMEVLIKEMIALDAQNDNIVKQHKDLVTRIESLEQEVQDINYLSPKKETESWY